MNDHDPSLATPMEPEHLHAAESLPTSLPAATSLAAEPHAAVLGASEPSDAEAAAPAVEGSVAVAESAPAIEPSVTHAYVEPEAMTAAPPADEAAPAEATHSEAGPLETPAEAPVAASEPVASSDAVAPSLEPVESEPIVASEPIASSEPVTASEPIVASEPVAATLEPVVATGEALASDPPGESDAAGTPRPPKQRSDAELAALRRRAQESWQRVVAAKDSGEILEGTVIAVVKGGALVDISGVRGFLPASQVRAPEGGTLEGLIKTKLALKILDTEPGRRRAVVSNRRALEEQRRSKRAEVLATLKVGERREGTVVRLTDFGAFVDLGGIDGLIPMSELAVERVEKAGDVVKVGEKLMVDVLRVDEGGKKISLSRKSALPDPWRDSIASLRVGSVIEGKVVGFEPRFTVEIAPGITGTIRDSDADPTEYSVGEAIEVTIRNIDRRTRRITLIPSFGGAQPELAPQPRQTSSGFAPLGVELERALAKARSKAERNG